MSNARPLGRHYCDHSDCGKSFRRAEHLTRHKLNHTNSTIPCPECDRLFYRKDLLQRHLTLKHGKVASRVNRRANSVNSPQLDVSPARYDGTHIPAPRGSAHNLDIDSPNQFPAMTVVATNAPADEISANDVLPIASDLFQFPSPSLDLAQDWGWLQYPIPVLPVISDSVGPVASNGFPEFQVFNQDWMTSSGGSFQDLYISQEVYDFIVTLEPIVEASRSFTTHDVNTILNSAFVYIMDSIPIFHRPTFSFDLIPSQLCAAIFSVGLLIAPEPTLYPIGCELLARLRTDLLQHVDKTTIYLSDMGILQALLLTEFAGVYLADRTAMELSDIFHGTLVTLCRRLGLFEMSSSNPRDASRLSNRNELENPVEHESAKRLAYFVFSLDVEHMLFFGHERSILSVYSMKIELPSDDTSWQIPDQGLRKQQGTTYPTKFHLLCRNLLSSAQGHASVPQNLNQFSNFIIILGLSSVVMELLRRQQDPFFDTKQALSCLGSVLPVIHTRLMAGPEGSMKTNGRAVYHITAIALSTPLDDLERAANDGFSRTGRTPKQHTRAAIIRLLTKHKVGAESARHAVHLLRLYLIHSVNSLDLVPASTSSPATHPPYEPSALYFGVLTLWAYVIGRVSEDDDGTQLNEDSYLSEGNTLPSQTATSSSAAGQSIAALLQGMEAAIQNDDKLACWRQLRSIVHNVTTVLSLKRNCNAKEYSQVLGSLTDSLAI